MRVLGYAFFAWALAAQVPAPQPHWLSTLQKVQQGMHQAPLGSLDGTVEQAWRAALQMPGHPRFHTAVQMTWSFYRSQGYDLKAEQVLRQALAVVPPHADPQARRSLMLQLAVHFESTNQLVKALAIREEIANEAPLPAAHRYSPPGHEAAALASLYERIGEFEKAEEAWKTVTAQRAADGSREGAGSGPPSIIGSTAPGYRIQGHNELAGFYARRGMAPEAERIYKKALADTAQGVSPYEWSWAAEGYIAFLTQQRRFDEAIGLARESIARMEGTSDPHAVQFLLNQRQRLAGLLTQAGRPGEALAVQKQAVEAAQARSPGGPEYVQALGSLAQMLINQNRLEEAEKAVARMREAGSADTPNARFHELMAAQMLARIRDMQKRPEEARELRARVGVPDLAAAGPPGPLDEGIGSARQAAVEGSLDVALAAIDRALALAAERIPANPQEASVLLSLASVLMSKQKVEEARRIVIETFRILEQAPDHPRVADALGSVVSTMAGLGMTAEAEDAIARQERILISAKGAESPALDAIAHGRIRLMQRNADWAGVIDERSRMLARTEKATGSKSRESLYALRELAWAYPPANNWMEEERLLSRLRERTASSFGEYSLEHAQVLQHTANRAAQNRQFEQALTWMDRAIEIARALPDAGIHLRAMTQDRLRIAQAKDAPPGSAPNQWFDSGRFHRTDGARLGVAPAKP